MNTGNAGLVASKPASQPGDLLAEPIPAAPEGRRVLALVDAVDRHGNVLARLPVTRWPVTVGRSLDADLVLDDAHIAALHLRLAQTASGCVAAQVLDSTNGVVLGRHRHGRGARFDWKPGQTLSLGRSMLHLRLADTPVPAEQPFASQAPGAWIGSVAAVLLVLLLMSAQVWLKTAEPQKLLQQMPVVLLGALGVLLVWAGLWALVTKVFGARPQFWRHVRIASLAFVVTDVLEFAAQAAAFALSWENLGRFSYLALLGVAGVALYRHLLVVAPQSRRGLALGVLVVVALGLPGLLGSQWLKNKRLSNQLYMAQMFPPSWRLAQPVPVGQFLQEATSIEQRLARRLKDRQDEDAGEGAAGDEE